MTASSGARPSTPPPSRGYRARVPRPAVVVSIDPINDLRPDILVIPITTHPGPLRVRLPDNVAATGLREPSFAKCESGGPLHKSHLKSRIGQLPSAWPLVEAGLCRVLGLPGS